MKVLLQLALPTLLLTAAPAAHAQFFVGAGAAVQQYHKVGFFPGIQARAGYELNDGRMATDFGFSWSPFTKKEITTLPYTDPATMAVRDLKLTRVLTAASLFGHGHYHIGTDEQDLQFGFIAGLAFDVFTLRYELEHEPAGFNFKDQKAYQKKELNNFTVDLGVKANYRVGHGALYAEAIYGLPILNDFDQGPVALRSHYGVNFGYKFYIGDTRYYARYH